jgi:transposase InsO family protein
MIHVDVTEFANICDGGGYRYVGRFQSNRHRSLTALRTGRTDEGHPSAGTAFLHTVIGDHSRVAYVETCADGVTIERVLTDKGSAYKSHAWRDTCVELGITAKKTRPYRLQTNGKIERFHRTLADGWAHARLYSSETARRAALPAWTHSYNHRRTHSAIGGHRSAESTTTWLDITPRQSVPRVACVARRLHEVLCHFTRSATHPQ